MAAATGSSSDGDRLSIHAAATAVRPKRRRAVGEDEGDESDESEDEDVVARKKTKALKKRESSL